MSTHDDRAKLLARGDALWERLRAILDARLLDPLTDASEWNGRDVYAHLAHWQEATIADVRRMVAGRAPQPIDGDDDAINARWHDEDQALSPETARERCLTTREELQSLLFGLTSEQWERFGRLCSEDINGGHYEHHLPGVTA